MLFDCVQHPGALDNADRLDVPFVVHFDFVFSQFVLLFGAEAGQTLRLARDLGFRTLGFDRLGLLLFDVEFGAGQFLGVVEDLGLPASLEVVREFRVGGGDAQGFFGAGRARVDVRCVRLGRQAVLVFDFDELLGFAEVEDFLVAFEAEELDECETDFFALLDSVGVECNYVLLTRNVLNGLFQELLVDPFDAHQVLAKRFQPAQNALLGLVAVSLADADRGLDEVVDVLLDGADHLLFVVVALELGLQTVFQAGAGLFAGLDVLLASLFLLRQELFAFFLLVRAGVGEARGGARFFVFVGRSRARLHALAEQVLFVVLELDLGFLAALFLLRLLRAVVVRRVEVLLLFLLFGVDAFVLRHA